MNYPRRGPRYPSSRSTKPPKRKVPIPPRASACVMTPVPASHEKRMKYVMLGEDVSPSRAPTALVLYFDGFGMRRVYQKRRWTDNVGEFKGDHVVMLNRRWITVDITTMSLTEPPRA